MLVLQEKIGQFLYFLDHKGQNKLKTMFEYGSTEIQQQFNKRMEALTAFILLIGKTVLQEFSTCPQKIGIQSFDPLISRTDYVTNELEAFPQNLVFLREAYEIYKNCYSAYKIIQQTYERDPENPHKAKLISELLDKSRYFCGELLERFRVLERNFQANK